MKKENGIYLILFLLGMWIAQVLGREFFTGYEELRNMMYADLANVSVDYIDLFWNDLWIRGKQFLSLVFLCVMGRGWKQYYPYGLKGVSAILAGMWLMECVTIFGGAGICFFLASFFPQWICYGLAIGLLFLGEGSREICRKRNGKKVAILVGVCGLLLVGGAILETVVGTRLVRGVLVILNTPG